MQQTPLATTMAKGQPDETSGTLPFLAVAATPLGSVATAHSAHHIVDLIDKRHF